MVVKRNSLIARLCWHFTFIRIEDVRVGRDTTTYVRISWLP